MPIPATGPVSLAQIQTEYGGANPISLDEYYRGGANVPANSTTTTIPASGAISFDQFHSTSKSTSPPPSLTVNITPVAVWNSGPAGTVTTPSATAGVSGGTGPYTYAWSRVSGDTFTVTSPTAATTTFSASVGVVNSTKIATYKCTVTDSLGVTGSDTVDVEVDYNGGP